MLERFRGILEVIEYLDPTGREIVHRVPEEGSGEIRLGSQLIVRENQIAIFYRDGRALDMLGPGRHALTTLNVPILVNYLKIPFGNKSPFRASVVFVNLKDYLDLAWVAAKPIPYRDAEFGMVRLQTQGKFAFQVGRPQLFVNQIVGTQGLYATDDIVAYLRSIITSRLIDLLGEIKTSILDLPAKYDELGGGLRAKASEDFESLGLLLKGVYVTNIAVPPEIEKAIDERASMGALGDMQAYLQFKTARALGDAATQEGGIGAMTGAGVGMGAGLGLGATMANVIGQSMIPAAPQPTAVPGTSPGGGDLVGGLHEPQAAGAAAAHPLPGGQGGRHRGARSAHDHPDLRDLHDGGGAVGAQGGVGELPVVGAARPVSDEHARGAPDAGADRGALYVRVV